MIRVRVAALCVRGDQILLARHSKDARSSYLLPGGGLEDGETAHSALMRELREEASVSVSVGALRYVVEACAPDRSRHLVQLVFAARFDGDIGASSDHRVVCCEWHDFSELRSLAMHPAIGSLLAHDLESGAAPPCRYVLSDWAL